MQIQRKALQTALSQAKPFVGKGTATRCIMLDGPNQLLIATDFNAQIEIPLEIKDYTRKVTITPEVEIPGEALIAELNDLKVTQLKDLSEYAGTDEGKKAEMVDAIFQASKTSAEAEAKPSTEKMEEVLVMDHAQFSGIVNSLGGKPEEMVKLTVEKVTKLGELLETVVDTLSIGGVFQEIEVLDPTELTVMSDFEGATIGKAKSSELLRVAACYPASAGEGTQEFKLNMRFDRDRDQLMAVDGVRIHVQDVKLKGQGTMYAETRYIAKLAKLAKDTEIEIAVADDHNHLLFSFGKTRVWVAAEDAMAYPEIGKLIDEREGECAVTIDSKTLKQLFEQAGVVAARREHKDIRINLTFNGSLNVQAVSHMARYENLEVPYETGKVDGSHSLEFNPNYLSAALKGIGKKAVIGIMADESNPIRFSDEKQGFTALVMPMRDQSKKPEPEPEEVNEDQSTEAEAA
jgi:hypothetical protein